MQELDKNRGVELNSVTFNDWRNVKQEENMTTVETAAQQRI